MRMLIHTRIYLAAVCFLLLAFALALPVRAEPAWKIKASELIQAVNDLRASQGLSPYRVDAWLTSYAQEHSDYQASTGTSTHLHRDGHLPWEIGIQENVAGGDLESLTAEIVVHQIWADEGHRKTMTGYAAGFAGAGVASRGGTTYITLDVRPGENPATVTPRSFTPGPSDAPSQGSPPPFVPILTSTPLPDGSIVHVVGPGETLWSIAISYGVKVDEIRARNGLPAGSTSIYTGQKLTIRLPGSATPPEPASPTVSATSQPTRTRRLPTPTRTLRPTASRTLSPTPTLVPLIPAWLKLDQRTLAIVLLIVSGVGIILVLVFGFRK